MIPITTFSHQRVALFGLGGSGLATALALQAGGAELLAWDDNSASRDKAFAQNIPLGDLREADWSTFQALILSPGVPLTHPEPHWTVTRAREAGIEIIGDIELFCRERAKLAPSSPFIAITGTNGKSTTTALIAHLLKEAGRDVQMGGNIGTPILALAPPSDQRFHVIECSSFQIDLTPSLNPSIGVHLNLSPDHIDRHGSFEQYAAIKERLIAGSQIAVIGMDDEASRKMAFRRASKDHASEGRELVRISGEAAVPNGIFGAVKAVQGQLETHIIRIHEGVPKRLTSLAGIGSLRGTHNTQNACAALAACLAAGLTEEEALKGLSTYPGLSHRMEEVAHHGKVLFINDSKATNAESTEKALSAFSDVFWIVGGKAKEGGITALHRYFGRVRKAYLIGASMDEFAATLEGHVAFELCGMLNQAVKQASKDAALSDAEQPVVLLSPACASYDQFRNFEERGDRFRELVCSSFPNAGNASLL
jgi:UDP-N-acetylmuramoylalanine--D-glutamate ligase